MEPLSLLVHLVAKRRHAEEDLCQAKSRLHEAMTICRIDTCLLQSISGECFCESFGLFWTRERVLSHVKAVHAH